MPVHFIDNYPKNNLEAVITKIDGTPLYGEIWLYQEFLKFNDNNFLGDEIWYVKHNYNLSMHPSSNHKVEGQIDYLILSKYGLLVIEVKGGGIEVDENDVYHSFDRNDISIRYESQNPFTQAKEYAHSLRNLIDSTPFIYRAVIFPHEAGFELASPQLMGYKYLFFCKKNLIGIDSAYAKNKTFFDFIVALAKEARRTLISQLDVTLTKSKAEEKIWKKFPLLDLKEIKRLKSELFPIQNSYGFDPDRIKNEIILEENYDILNGLRKNRSLMVQGAPGTGKTILATKFLAENLLRQQKGIFYCANKLLRARIEYLVHEEYKLDPNSIQFKVFSPNTDLADVDFVIVDEAQEFFDKGLYDFIEKHDSKLNFPRWLILYDPEQAIVNDFIDIDWYTSFFIEASFVHYLFDTTWRCSQNKAISDITILLRSGQNKKLQDTYRSLITSANTVPEKLEKINNIIVNTPIERSKCILLIQSDVLESFKEIANDYFKKDLEELTESNVNVKNQKIKYTTPIKFRGLESETVIVITPEINDRTKIQNYIGATRAIYNLSFIIWH